MRICILLSPTVPGHLRETARRNGLQLVLLGAALRVRIGETLLGAQEATVWIEGEEPPPGDLQESRAQEAQIGP